MTFQRLRLVLLVGMLAMVASTSPAAGQRAAANPGLQLLDEAKQHWRDLDYDLVVAAADRALSQPTLSRQQRIEALELKGFALVVLGRNEAAIAAFEDIFALDPDHDVDDAISPRILGVFRPARARWQVRQSERLAMELGSALDAMRLSVRPPERPRGGLPLEVKVTLVDPSHFTDQVLLYYRRAGEHHFSSLAAPGRSGSISMAIPGAFTASRTAYRLELYVVARHRSGVTLRHEGSEDHPLSLAVEAGQVPAPPPVTSRWWFWTGTAALVVAAVAVPYLVDQSTSVGPQTIDIRRAP